MTHNGFNLLLDIILPIKSFLRKCDIKNEKSNQILHKITIIKSMEN